MSPYLHQLKVGSSLEVRGPVGRFRYEKNAFERIGLIAGGTGETSKSFPSLTISMSLCLCSGPAGLTPCLQVMRCILESPEYSVGEKTKFTLLFQNRREEDILMRSDLDQLQKRFPERVSIVYYLSNPPSQGYGVAFLYQLCINE